MKMEGDVTHSMRQGTCLSTEILFMMSSVTDNNNQMLLLSTLLLSFCPCYPVTISLVLTSHFNPRTWEILELFFKQDSTNLLTFRTLF